MAQHRFSQFALSLVKERVTLFMRVTFGATGAPTLDAVSSKGVKSITRNSAGNYTVVLGNAIQKDAYPKLFGVDVTYVCSSGSPAAPVNFLVSEQVATASNPSFVLQFVNSAGTATDPASGEEVRAVIDLTNSTAQ